MEAAEWRVVSCGKLWMDASPDTLVPRVAALSAAAAWSARDGTAGEVTLNTARSPCCIDVDVCVASGGEAARPRIIKPPASHASGMLSPSNSFARRRSPANPVDDPTAAPAALSTAMQPAARACTVVQSVLSQHRPELQNSDSVGRPPRQVGAAHAGAQSKSRQPQEKKTLILTKAAAALTSSARSGTASAAKRHSGSSTTGSVWCTSTHSSHAMRAWAWRRSAGVSGASSTSTEASAASAMSTNALAPSPVERAWLSAQSIK
eukprot:scaffold59245_cov36-Tisochrysis_lutea.AAC.1